jgi:hypothetical protein
MPKEIVHWLIAEQSASLLTECHLKNAVAANPACLRFGAVFPDVLFYLAGKSPFVRFSRLADILHGTGGEDTYRFLRLIREHTTTAGASGPMTAFWIGVAAHIQTDIVFHPFVYYFTGNYHDRNPAGRSLAIQRHRRLEVLLDMYFIRKKTGRQLRKYSLRRICNRLEMPLPQLLKTVSCALAKLSGDAPEEIAAALCRAVVNFVILQDICCRPFLGGILFRLEESLPQPLREITALFQTPQLIGHFSVLSEPLHYRNPVSGKEEAETTAESLFMQAVRDSANFCIRLKPWICSRSLPDFPERGPSLSFGIPGAASGDAHYFAPLSTLSSNPFFR